jgi:hypothetical protein
MAAFVGNDPETGGDKTSPEGIQSPEGKLGCAVEDRMWKLYDLRVDAGIEEGGGLVDDSQGDKIRDTGGIYASNFVCQQTKETVTDTYTEDRHPFRLKQWALK